MPRAARITDQIDHGGSIIEGSPNVYANNLKVARLGDAVACAIHGTVAIATASDTTFANSKGIARLGDSCTCGAVIVTASLDVYVDGD